jgi:hypothetical protein
VDLVRGEAANHGAYGCHEGGWEEENTGSFGGGEVYVLESLRKLYEDYVEGHSVE